MPSALRILPSAFCVTPKSTSFTSASCAHGFTLDSRAPSGRFNLNNVYGSGALAAEPPPVDVSRGPSAATLRLKGSSPLNLKGVAVGSPPRIGANNSAAPP